jgi:hypothetical protein
MQSIRPRVQEILEKDLYIMYNLYKRKIMKTLNTSDARERLAEVLNRVAFAKDRPIFQAALACGATHLLTGDWKDFGAYFDRPEETFDIHIQTVADFLARLLTSEP